MLICAGSRVWVEFAMEVVPIHWDWQFLQNSTAQSRAFLNFWNFCFSSCAAVRNHLTQVDKHARKVSSKTPNRRSFKLQLNVKQRVKKVLDADGNHTIKNKTDEWPESILPRVKKFAGESVKSEMWKRHGGSAFNLSNLLWLKPSWPMQVILHNKGIWPVQAQPSLNVAWSQITQEPNSKKPRKHENKTTNNTKNQGHPKSWQEQANKSPKPTTTDSSLFVASIRGGRRRRLLREGTLSPPSSPLSPEPPSLLKAPLTPWALKPPSSPLSPLSPLQSPLSPLPQGPLKT